MQKRIVLYSLMFTLLAGCTSYHTPRYDPALYPKCYQGYDLAFAWKNGREPENVTVDGFVRNNTSLFLRGLELNVELMDETGRKLSDAVFFFTPNLIQRDEIKPFDVKLVVPPGAVPKRLKFRYKYYYYEPKSTQIPNFQSFEAEL